MNQNGHKSGFVSIIGKPNVGKSTLMNQLVGEKLSIITSKAQTTRHRIMGILSGENFQIIYSDTPGILNPQYNLHQSMMRFVSSSLEDADIILFVTDIYEKYENEPFIERLKNSGVPLILVMNKIDLAKGSQAEDKMDYWRNILEPHHQIMISALNGKNIDTLFSLILDNIPEHPPYFPKDELTDKPERFFAAEILREKILDNYKKEVPYSCEVLIEEFLEDETLIKMRAIIYVERSTQRAILLGHQGERIKKTGTEARLDMEAFFGKKVFLEQYIKVEPNWRSNEKKLNRFGYN
ncbi:MAG: GTPase Era [Cyclobacteriaceae bacterium]|nr:GTPase Era [Cyclobacteriaceae bacterium]